MSLHLPVVELRAAMPKPVVPKPIADGVEPIPSGNGHSSAPPAKPLVLNSWKEIAAHLGRGVRTVQRWELDFGLPVHRPKGKDRGAVLAIPEELSQWLLHTPVRTNGNGNGNGNGTHEAAAMLLDLARELLAHGERLSQLDRKHKPEMEKLVQAVREILRELEPAPPPARP